MDTIKEGQVLIDKIKNLDGPLQDEGTHDMATRREGFDPGVYNKAWIAALGTFGSQWGINFNDAINQVVLNPPENMLQAIILMVVVSSGVAYVANRKS